MGIEEVVRSIFNEHMEVVQKSRDLLIKDISDAATLIVNTLKSGGKVLICGNGGSAADAQHFAAELVVRFKRNRNAVPAIALTTDTSVLTATGNDFSFEDIFARQVEALGNKGDILIAISTSGKSRNVVKAAEIAKKKGMYVIALTGKDGGELKNICDIPIVVPSNSTARIQEVHEIILHIFAEIVEERLFGEKS